MSSDKLTKKQKEELEMLINDVSKEAKNVKKDYDNNPSEISGSTIRVHQDSPYMSDSKALEGDKWKQVLIPKKK